MTVCSVWTNPNRTKPPIRQSQIEERPAAAGISLGIALVLAGYSYAPRWHPMGDPNRLSGIEIANLMESITSSSVRGATSVSPLRFKLKYINMRDTGNKEAEESATVYL